MQNKSYLYRLSPSNNKSALTKIVSRDKMMLFQCGKGSNFFDNSYIFGEQINFCTGLPRKNQKIKKNHQSDVGLRQHHIFPNKTLKKKRGRIIIERSLSLLNRQHNASVNDHIPENAIEIIHSRRKSQSFSRSNKHLQFFNTQNKWQQMQIGKINCQVKKINFQKRQIKTSASNRKKSVARINKVLNVYPSQDPLHHQLKENQSQINSVNRMQKVKRRPYRPWSPDRNQQMAIQIGPSFQQGFLEISL